MIEKSDSWKTSDGHRHGSLEEAQKYELDRLFVASFSGMDAAVRDGFFESMVEKAEEVIAILRSTGRKPRKRKTGRSKGSRNKSVVAANNNAVEKEV